jgi:hypothetical protein
LLRSDAGIEVFSGRGLLAGRRQEIGALVDTHDDFVVAEAQPVAIGEFDRSGFGGRRLRVVDEDAVGADVLYPVGAAAELDLAVVAGNDALGIGQDPVVVGGATDAAAIDAEHATALLAELTMLVADDSQFDGHDPCPCIPVAGRIRADAPACPL